MIVDDERDDPLHVGEGQMASHAKNERDVLARIGAILIQIQRTELTINFCIQHVLPKTARPAKDLFAAGGRRPPLGRLITELHRQVGVPNSFKDTLAEFLDWRNTLVHQIEFVPGWTLETERGIAVAHRFLGRLESLDRRVNRVFDALIKAWKLKQSSPLSAKEYNALMRSLTRLP
jgi:hypothetical protein